MPARRIATALPGRIGPERGDALSLREQLAEALMERRRGVPSDGVLLADGPALLDDLARGVEALGVGEARRREPGRGGGDLFVERGHW
jgi:hypothetical protein